MSVDGHGPARITVAPESGRLDEPVTVCVDGLRPGTEVTLRLRTTDGACQDWESRTAFLADERGRVDPATRAPLDGGYDGIDPDGIFWSMTPVDRDRPVFFTRRRPAPLRMRLVAQIRGEDVAEREFVRAFADPGVEATALPPDTGLVGTLHAPQAPSGPRPGVLLLAGSDGGQHDHAAALLASHGYAVLALTYFGAEDLPQHLHGVELGYFRTALDWLADRPGVDPGALVVVGLSRGGELALQLGSMYPQVRGVVAGSPSSVRQAGLTEKHTDFTKPAWLDGGEPLPFVPGRYGPREFFGFMGRWMLRRPVAQRATFERLLDAGPAAETEIEVERIAGPVLLVSGTDDRLWPSDRYAELVVDRMRRHGRGHLVEHRSHPGAGHFVCLPYGMPCLPPMLRLSPVAGLTIDFGGTAPANAAAARASWADVLAFLERVREHSTVTDPAA